MTDLEIGITLPIIQDLDTLADIGGVAAAARHIEQVGLDFVGIADVVVGDGTPALDAIVAATTAAAATQRIRVEFGVLALPLRPIAQLATQLASLQQVSGDRISLGVGIGGFGGTPYWHALEVPAHERGRRADTALALLPRLIAGEPTTLDHLPDAPVVTLAPPAAVPPILVGGSSAAAIRRAAAHGDGWAPSLRTPAQLAAGVDQLRELTTGRDRPTPVVHYGTHAILTEDATARAARDRFVRSLVDDHGRPPDEAEQIPVTGGPTEVAERFAAYAEAGAHAITLALDGAHWMRQCETVAAARSLL